MVGVIREIHVAPGDTVAAGERVITMEAMKMDIYVNAPESGAITGVSCAAGESVAEGTVLATIARSDG
jgi:3-methylcrotonyl-CoA carboxylase alpha subunit